MNDQFLHSFASQNTTDAFSISSNGANGFFKIRDEYNSADRFTILNDGKVGIGTTSPTGALHVTSSTATTNGMVRFQNNMDNNYETLRIESLGNYDAHIGFFADGDANPLEFDARAMESVERHSGLETTSGTAWEKRPICCWKRR